MTRCSCIRLTASAASARGPMQRRIRVHHVAHRGGVQVDAAIERAAQVAVGEHAEQALVRASTTAVSPRPLRAHLDQALRQRRIGTHARQLVAARASRRRRAAAACGRARRPGCERAKSSAVKPRASSSAMASASPIASVAVVLAVGARFSGQASSATLTSRCTAASRASVEAGLPVIAITGVSRRAQMRQQATAAPRSRRSWRCAITTSPRATMPEVAVAGLGGMQEEGGRAGARQRGGDLAADVARTCPARSRPRGPWRRGTAGRPRTKVASTRSAEPLDRAGLDRQCAAAGCDQRGGVGSRRAHVSVEHSLNWRHASLPEIGLHP